MDKDKRQTAQELVRYHVKHLGAPSDSASEQLKLYEELETKYMSLLDSSSVDDIKADIDKEVESRRLEVQKKENAEKVEREKQRKSAAEKRERESHIERTEEEYEAFLHNLLDRWARLNCPISEQFFPGLPPMEASEEEKIDFFMDWLRTLIRVDSPQMNALRQLAAFYSGVRIGQDKEYSDYVSGNWQTILKSKKREFDRKLYFSREIQEKAELILLPDVISSSKINDILAEIEYLSMEARRDEIQREEEQAIQAYEEEWRECAVPMAHTPGKKPTIKDWVYYVVTQTALIIMALAFLPFQVMVLAVIIAGGLPWYTIILSNIIGICILAGFNEFVPEHLPNKRPSALIWKEDQQSIKYYNILFQSREQRLKNRNVQEN